MIKSAEEFVQLRTSEWPEDYRRAAHEEAPLEVWLNIVEWYPDKVAGVDPIAYLVAAATRAKRDSGAPLLPGEFKAAA